MNDSFDIDIDTEDEPELAPPSSNGRVLTLEADVTNAPDPVLAQIASAIAEDSKPKPPIGRWIGFLEKARDPSKPLFCVSHLVAKAAGAVFTARCGVPVMSSRARLKEDRDDTEISRCGWCVIAETGKAFPDFDSGRQRPVLPDGDEDQLIQALRTSTPVAASIGALTSEKNFQAKLDELQESLKRMTGDERWVPSRSDLDQLILDIGSVRAAAKLRDQRRERRLQSRETPAAETTETPTTVTPEEVLAAEANATAMDAARRRDEAGRRTKLADVRVGRRNLPTLFRCIEPVGPFILGYRSAGGPHWIVRDVRITDDNPDRDFNADKAAAREFLVNQGRKFPEFYEQAKARLQPNDPLRRAR